MQWGAYDGGDWERAWQEAQHFGTRPKALAIQGGNAEAGELED